jgi:gas vesicle protein
MKKNMSNFLLGFLAGAAAGAIAGILFAPEKGSQTRQNIRKKVRDLSDEYGLGLGDLMEELGLEPETATAASAKQRKPKSKHKTEAPKGPSAPKRKYTRRTKAE